MNSPPPPRNCSPPAGPWPTRWDRNFAIGLIGADLAGAPQQAIAHGADKAYAVTNPALADYHPGPVPLGDADPRQPRPTPTSSSSPATTRGASWPPAWLSGMGVGLAQDCLEVSADASTGKLLANRPVYGGSAVAVVSCNQTPQIAAIRPKTYEPLDADTGRSGQVVAFPVEIDPSAAKTRVVDVVKEEAEGIKLEDARIVVSGGRGLGGPEPFAQLEELANLLGGAVGASRAAVDSGWVPANYQVGLTGKTITPDLYITVAISGASQHMAGCSGSKAIVAINKDADANIFKDARYGVVGDWEKVIPALTETVRELTQS